MTIVSRCILGSRFMTIAIIGCLSPLLFNSVHAQSPVQANWASAAIGPDGPWQAVEVSLGHQDTVALYPGHLFQTWAVTTDYCKLNASDGCFATMAGTYNQAQGMRSGTGGNGGIRFSPPLGEFMLGMDVQGEDSTSWMEHVDAGAGVENVSMVLVESQMAAYPGGQWYPVFAGCLGVGGARTVNQSFTYGTTLVNASLIPGMLWEQGNLPSNSFGMHIGSSSSGIDGSLWWGGYDQNRVVGGVLSTRISNNDDGPDEETTRLRVLLKDISIEVIEGSSPFNFSGTRLDSLLSMGDNAELFTDDGITVNVDGCSPYLTLPRETCDNIASNLPVILDPDLGLYLWDTESSQYSSVVASASSLSFSLQSRSPYPGSTEDITIRVPFSHLNLTLSRPLRDVPTPYFPCFTGGQGSPTLGRAFLQDAFLGANWGQSTWWLAQAPGPSARQSARVVSIEEHVETIESGSGDWKDSWKGFWKVLAEGDVSGSDDTDLETSEPAESGSTTGGAHDDDEERGPEELSTAAKAGIGVGAGVAALGIAFASFALHRKRRERRQVDDAVTDHKDVDSDFLHSDSSPVQSVPAEADGIVREAKLAELVSHSTWPKKRATETYELA